MATSSAVSDTVNRIILRVACTEGHESSPVKQQQQEQQQGMGGPLTRAEVSELSLLCVSSNANTNTNNQFAAVEAEQLLALLQSLIQHVNQTVVQVDFIGEALAVWKQQESPSRAAVALDQWLKTAGSHRLEELSLALEAAAVATYIATTPGVDQRVINEDHIQACITLMRQHLTKHLIPAINQTGHLLHNSSQLQQQLQQQQNTPKRRRSSSDGGLSKDLKKVYKSLISSTLHLQLVLMERLQVLVQQVALDGAQLLSLTNGTLQTFQIASPAQQQQQQQKQSQQSQHHAPLPLVALRVLVAVFGRYPTHRDSMVQDLFPVILQLPAGKRSLRCFPIRYTSASAPDSLRYLQSELLQNLVGAVTAPSNTAAVTTAPTSIQLMSALILALVQASVQRPGYQQNQQQQEQEWNSGLQGCLAVADGFVEQLLHRCPTSAEFRAFLTHFVEDLLMVLIVPEFPAAEYLLQALQRRLFVLVSTSGNSSGKGAASSFLTTAFDCMGKICAVQARLLALQKARPLQFTFQTDNEDDNDDDQEPVLACYCQKNARNVFLVGCVGCKTLYHGRCVGMTQKEEWYCDACRLGHIWKRTQYHELEGLDPQEYTVRHAFQAAIAHRLGVEGLEYAVHMHLAQWMGDLIKSAMPPVTDLLKYWDTPGPSGEILTEEGSARLILHVKVKTSGLVKSFRDQVRFILKLAANDSHALRKLSLKAIEKMVEGDPDQMLLPIITKSVSRRLTDDSISVREAALSLVGLYVTRSPAVANAFHSSLLPRLTDTGVSVRKRAVKTFEAVLKTNPSYKGRSSVFDAMLQRAADPKEEDGVRDLIDNLFSHLWLDYSDDEVVVNAPPARTGGEDSPIATCSTIAVESAVPPVTPTPQKCQDRPPQRRSDLAAEQMIEVVRSAGSTANLEALLKKFLSASADEDKSRKHSERKKRKELDQKQCEKIVRSLFEYLVSIEEEKDARGNGFGKDLAATLRTISVFSEVSPEFVFRQVDSILPYLKADNGVTGDEESSIVAAVCEIIYRLAQSFNKQLVDRLAPTSTLKDLKNITFRFGPFALSSAIRAFSSLAQQTDNVFSKKLLDLAKMFYTYLYKRRSFENFDQADAKTRSGVHRALTVLGFICQYQVDVVDSSIWDEEKGPQDAELFTPQHMNWSNMMLACYRIFSQFLLKEDSGTKCTALRALGGIFVSQPRLLLQLDQEGLVEELMSSDVDSALQLESMQCWSKILKAEEKRIDSGHAKEKMDSNGHITLSKRISGDQDGDSTLFGGVLTNHASRLFEMTKEQDETLRYAVLEVLGLLLRQGLVNPNDAVPYLYALSGDIENENIQSLAHQLLSTEGEKRPDTLRRRICAGVKEAYKFQSIVYSHTDQISSIVVTKNGKETVVECIFSRVFRECIANNRKERRGFFKNLLSLFRLDAGRKSAKKDLALLQFVSQMLAHLEYRSVDDPLFIIHEITSLVGLQGAAVLDKLAAVLRPVGLANEDECDDDIAVEDSLERAARSQFPSRTNEAVPLSSQHFDMAQFVSHCRDGTALALALELKTFLRRAYNFSETRCLEYDPGANERICDKGAPKASISSPFGAVVPRSFLEDNARVDKDAVIRQYAKFRQLMREETNMELPADGLEDEEMDEDEIVHESGEKRALDEI